MCECVVKFLERFSLRAAQGLLAESVFFPRHVLMHVTLQIAGSVLMVFVAS